MTRYQPPRRRSEMEFNDLTIETGRGRSVAETAALSSSSSRSILGSSSRSGRAQQDEAAEARIDVLTANRAYPHRSFRGVSAPFSAASYYPTISAISGTEKPRTSAEMIMRTIFIGALCTVAMIAGVNNAAHSQDVLKVAVPQRGSWDAGLPELGKRGNIFRKHGLDLEILYTQAGPESIQALIAGSVDIATASGVQAAFGTFGKGAPIPIISSEIIGSPDLYWYVPATSPIRKIEDFNGKTVAYSLTGSSSHAGLLALIAQYKLTAKPTSTGSISATLTQTMTGQVDVGFSGVPFFLDQMEDGKIRIIATGSDVDALKSRSGRVNITNLQTLQNRRDVLVRFHAAYKETIEWMYSDPAALKIFSEFTNLPERVVSKVRELVPKETLAPDRIVGVDQIIAEAVGMKFLAAPLTPEQVKELIQIPH